MQRRKRPIVERSNRHTVTGTTRTDATDANGAYSIADLAPGAYTVAATLVGYRRGVRADVRVSSGETTVDLVLELLPLQAVTVTATLREQELADILRHARGKPAARVAARMGAHG